MMKVAKFIAAGLVGMGIAEIVFRGASASLFAWYLLFALWVVTLFIRFIQAAVDAYKAAFPKGSDGRITSPEYEQRMASFNRSNHKKKDSPESEANPDDDCHYDTDDWFHEKINPFVREDDPFGLFSGD